MVLALLAGAAIGYFLAEKGDGGEQTIEVNNEAVNKRVFDYMTSVVNSTEGDVKTVNILKAGDLTAYGCKVCANATTTVDMKVISSFTNEQTVDLQTTLINEMETELDQGFKSETGVLAFPPVTADQRANVTNSIRNEIETNINMDTINNAIANVNSRNEIDVGNITADPCGQGILMKYPTAIIPGYEECIAATRNECCIDLNSQLFAKVVVDNMNINVSGIKDSLEAYNSQTSTISQDQDVKSKGLEALFEGWYIMIIALVGLAVIGGGGYYMIRKSGKSKSGVTSNPIFSDLYSLTESTGSTGSTGSTVPMGEAWPSFTNIRKKHPNTLIGVGVFIFILIVIGGILAGLVYAPKSKLNKKCASITNNKSVKSYEYTIALNTKVKEETLISSDCVVDKCADGFEKRFGVCIPEGDICKLDDGEEGYLYNGECLPYGGRCDLDKPNPHKIQVDTLNGKVICKEESAKNCGLDQNNNQTYSHKGQCLSIGDDCVPTGGSSLLHKITINDSDIVSCDRVGNECANTSATYYPEADKCFMLNVSKTPEINKNQFLDSNLPDELDLIFSDNSYATVSATLNSENNPTDQHGAYNDALDEMRSQCDTDKNCIGVIREQVPYTGAEIGKLENDEQLDEGLISYTFRPVKIINTSDDKVIAWDPDKLDTLYTTRDTEDIASDFPLPPNRQSLIWLKKEA
jgi:hypothetical protein